MLALSTTPRLALRLGAIRAIDAIVCGAVCERNRELLFGQVLTPWFDLVFVVADDSRAELPDLGRTTSLFRGLFSWTSRHRRWFLPRQRRPDRHGTCPAVAVARQRAQLEASPLHNQRAPQVLAERQVSCFKC